MTVLSTVQTPIAAHFFLMFLLEGSMVDFNEIQHLLLSDL